MAERRRPLVARESWLHQRIQYLRAFAQRIAWWHRRDM